MNELKLNALVIFIFYQIIYENLQVIQIFFN